MTKSLQFTALVDTEIVATDGFGSPLLAERRGALQLADSLKQAGHGVIVQEAPLADAAPDRLILYFGGDVYEALERCASRADEIRNRLIVMDVDRVTAGEIAREIRPLAVITTRSFQNWLRDSNVYAQLFGLTSIALALKIDLDDEERSREYVDFVIPSIGLPGGIARYCSEAERNR
jgi:hypothetical protein